MRNGLMQDGVVGMGMVRDGVQNGVGRRGTMQARARRGTTAVLALLLAAALAAPLAADPVRTVEAEAGKVKVQGGAQKNRGRGKAKAPVPGGPNDETAIWWKDSGIQKALSLEDSQREKMDRLLTAYREKVPPPNRMETFHELLVQGDWERAESENERLVANAAKAIRMRGRLKVDVLSVLTEKQRKILVDRFPRLIYKPWTRAMRGNASR